MLRMVNALKDDDKLSNSTNQTTTNTTRNKKKWVLTWSCKINVDIKNVSTFFVIIK